MNETQGKEHPPSAGSLGLNACNDWEWELEGGVDPLFCTRAQLHFPGD